MVQYIKRLCRFEAPTRLDWVIYFTVFIVLQIPAIINFYYNNGSNNTFTLFAQSLLHGQLTLPPMQSYGDMISFKNEYYLPYPPFPSLVLLPFVAVLGTAQVNTVAIATVMACISLYLIYRILIKLQIAQEYLIWLLMAIFFGTGFWYALFTSHHVYAFAHVTSFLLQLLIINELLGKRRWWLISVFIGCSFLTRQFTLFYLVFAIGYMVYLHLGKKETLKTRNIILLFVPISAFIALYLAYNYVRFGNAFDTGYAHILFIGILKERVNEYGVFSSKYFLFNLYSFFIKGFNIQFEGKTYLNIKDMDLWGTSLLAASPFLVASLKAEWPKILRFSGWLTIGIILISQLFYHNNGWHQVNTSRFSLDFLPLLVVLAALGVNHVPKWLFKGMVIYAVLLNVIGFLIHFLYQ